MLARGGNGPLTIAEIREARPDLAVSSVYRNLVVLEQADVVHRVVDPRRLRLLRARRGAHRAPSPRRVLELRHRRGRPASPTIEQSVRDVARQVAGRTGFKTQRHRLDLFGLCESCG